MEKQRKADPTVKCLVVSQFASFLRLLKQPLEGRGFNFVFFDGSLSQEKRVTAIRDFNNCSPGSPTVILLSLKAGGVGLNLTAASRVFLMDPVSTIKAKNLAYVSHSLFWKRKYALFHPVFVLYLDVFLD